jgi:hypothetical protein
MGLLSRLKIRTKLASMVALSALTVCAIIALSASLRSDACWRTGSHNCTQRLI